MSDFNEMFTELVVPAGFSRTIRCGTTDTFQRFWDAGRKEAFNEAIAKAKELNDGHDWHVTRMLTALRDGKPCHAPRNTIAAANDALKTVTTHLDCVATTGCKSEGEKFKP